MIPPTDRPRVTVLIPCLNDGELIGETLTSLLQDHDLEIVIVDDASTDQATLEILRGLEAEGLTVVWREENGGVRRPRRRPGGQLGTLRLPPRRRRRDHPGQR